MMSRGPQPSNSPTPPRGTIDVPVPADSPTSSFTTLATPPAGVSTAAAAADSHSPPRGRRLVGPRRQLVIVFGITSSLLICALTIGVLYMKWYRTNEYDTKIIVWGEPEWVGAKVTVNGPALTAGPLLGELTERDNLLLRFHVPQGVYDVRVTRGEKVLAERKGRLLTHPGRITIWWPFRRPPTATQSSEP